jgi:hypothetical protein
MDCPGERVAKEISAEDVGADFQHHGHPAQSGIDRQEKTNLARSLPYPMACRSQMIHFFFSPSKPFPLWLLEASYHS